MKKTVLISCCISLCTLLLSSCKKNESKDQQDFTHYTGILVDFATRSPIPNHKIYLRKLVYPYPCAWELSCSDTSLILPNVPPETIDSTITNSSGFFTFSYPPLVPPGELLNYYWPTLGNQDNIFCFTFYFVRLGPQPITDTFFTEPPRILKITMQKSAPVSSADVTFQYVNLYNDRGIFLSKNYFKGQAGMTNHTIEFPYSEHFANTAYIKWQYKGNLNSQVAEDTIALYPLMNTSKVIHY